MITGLSGGYMTLGIVKLCCRVACLTHIPPPNCQFPNLKLSPIAPHVTPTEETSISVSVLFFFLSPRCGTYRALLGVSAFVWDTE